MNSFEIGRFTLTGTAYYVSGYKSVAEDQNGHGVTNCNGDLYGGTDTNFGCHAKSFIEFDFVGQVKVSDNFTFYVNASTCSTPRHRSIRPTMPARRRTTTRPRLRPVSSAASSARAANFSFRPKEHVVPLEPVVAPPPPPPATQTCPDGSVIEATAACPAPPPPPPPPAAAPERG